MAWDGASSFSCKILSVDKFFFLITTPKSNSSKHFKHLRKAVGVGFQQLDPCRHCRFRAGSFSGLSSRIQVWHICHVDRHGHFTLKQLRLSLVNEVHTNSYAGPRLIAQSIIISASSTFKVVRIFCFAWSWVLRPQHVSFPLKYVGNGDLYIILQIFCSIFT